MKPHHDPAAVAAALERRLAAIGAELRRTRPHLVPRLIHRAGILMDHLLDVRRRAKAA